MSMTATDLGRYVDRLQSLQPPGGETVQLRFGVITAVDMLTNPSTVSVQMSGSEPVIGLRTINSYFPRVDDAVVMAKQGGDLFVLGTFLNDDGSGTVLPSDPSFDSVDIGGNILDTTSDPITGLSIVPGIAENDVFLDVSWTASPTANEYQIEIAEKVAGVYQGPRQFRVLAPVVSFRVENLKPATTYGVRVYALNKLGLPSDAAPAVGFFDVATGVDETIPSPVTGLVATAGIKSIVVVWNDSADFDFDRYQLEIATDVGFTTGVRDVYERGSIGGFDDLSPATMYWARVRAIDTSDNQGPWTAAAFVTTRQLTTADITPLAIDSAAIADLAVLTAKIADAAITDAKVHDLVVDKVEAGTIASKDYVLAAGGQIRSALLAPGFVINSQGISFYDSSGVRTIFLDAATGSGTFFGTIAANTLVSSPIIQGGTITGSILRTGATGNRIHIEDSGGVGYILLWTGDTDEYFNADIVAGVAGGGGTRQLFVRVQSGAYSTSPGIARTHWYSDQHDTNFSAVIEHYADRHAFRKGVVASAEADFLAEAPSKGFYTAYSNDDGATFKGTWGPVGVGGAAGALRGATGHAIFFEWTGTQFRVYVDGLLVRTL